MMIMMITIMIIIEDWPRDRSHFLGGIPSIPDFGQTLMTMFMMTMTMVTMVMVMTKVTDIMTMMTTMDMMTTMFMIKLFMMKIMMVVSDNDDNVLFQDHQMVGRVGVI